MIPYRVRQTLAGITTGYCDDNTGSSISSPYLWPILDVDTTDDGKVITHIAYTEWGFCEDVPADDIDASTLVYARKIADVADEPWGGTWDGPYFMDSVYNIAHIVRADKRPGHHEVYYVYLQPMYYATGPNTSPCPGNGHYQHSSEVVYRFSDDDGASWDPPVKITDNIFGFEDGLTDPATYEISAMIDPSGNLHVVWLSSNRDPESPCGIAWACRLWHWDSGNDCISMAFDASHPALMPGTSNGRVPGTGWLPNRIFLIAMTSYTFSSHVLEHMSMIPTRISFLISAPAHSSTQI